MILVYKRVHVGLTWQLRRLALHPSRSVMGLGKSKNLLLPSVSQSKSPAELDDFGWQNHPQFRNGSHLRAVFFVPR
jgi:hypothetical protein